MLLSKTLKALLTIYVKINIKLNIKNENKK